MTSAPPVEKHPSQKTEGDLAQRHADVLLAKTPAELEAVYDKWATKYDEDLGVISGLGSNWGRSGFKIVKQKCSPETHPRLLDFGCGTGIAGPSFQEIGWNGENDTILHGCDLSQGMLDVSEARGCYTKLIKSTYEDSGAEAGYYNVIHASGIFAPAQAPPETFDQFLRLLQPAGLTVFTIRTGYYDGPEGAGHKQHLEQLCKKGRWTLISQTEEEYLPKEDLTCYVF
jgi:predicted TPR repeat methyltransferase